MEKKLANDLFSKYEKTVEREEFIMDLNWLERLFISKKKKKVFKK